MNIKNKETNKILIVDWEATCDDGIKNYPKEKREIIEIGAVVADYEGNTYDEFSIFAKPVIIPILSGFCVELTSITQEQVENAPLLKTAFESFNSYCDFVLDKHPELIGWGSWGYYDKGKLDYDIKTINRTEIFSLNILNLKHYNISDIYRLQNRLPKKAGLQKALHQQNMSFIGIPHRGIDDVKNIARLLPKTFK
jgi:inhibitor of KinA sporulation pathway (predicted exonuclease)